MTDIKINKNIIFYGGDIFVQYCLRNEIICSKQNLKNIKISGTTNADISDTVDKADSSRLDVIEPNNLPFKLPLNITLINELSRGVYGITYICSIENKNELFIMKVPIHLADETDIDKNKLFNEISFNIAAGNIGISPKILSLFKCSPIKEDLKQLPYESLGRTRCDDNFYEKNGAALSKINMVDVPYVPPFNITKHVYLMEYITGGTLNYYLKNKSYDANFSQILTIIDSYKNIVDELHKLQIKHNDLHTNNILINDDLKLQIIDYGLSFKYKVEDIENYKQVFIYDRYDLIKEDNKYILDNYYANLFKFSDLLMGYLYMTSNVINDVDKKISTENKEKFIDKIIDILDSEIKLLNIDNFKFNSGVLYRICNKRNRHYTTNIYIAMILVLNKIYNPKIFNVLVDIYVNIYPHINYKNYTFNTLMNDREKKTINAGIDIIKEDKHASAVFINLMLIMNDYDIILKNVLIQHGNDYIKSILSFAQAITHYESKPINDELLKKYRSWLK